MLSLILAFFLATLLYKNQITALAEKQLIVSGKQIIQSYQQSQTDDLEGLAQDAGLLLNYRVQIYDDKGEAVRPQGVNNQKLIMTKDQIQFVLNGGVYRGEPHGTPNKGAPEGLIIGLPFKVNNSSYALFIKPDISEITKQFGQLLRTVLIIVLIIGSLFIAIAARYLVKPLRQLTEATRKLAKGDFSVHVQSKRKDEIGILTTSINDMAQELGRLDQMRQDFVANVSHEIQSPLTSIKGFSKALQNKALDEVKRIHYLTIIEEESERLSRLSENLLKLSSLQYEHHPFHPHYYRLDEQLRGVLIACEPLWASKQLQIDLELGEVSIQGDEDQLNQVWLNLIHNSIKFTPDKGVISIKLKAKSSNAIVTLTDSGMGIPAEELDDIFKPFYKVDKARSDSSGGSGLGLSIVKRIVDIHQGDIEVVSPPEGGTSIILKLPLEGKM
ncbi:sensor histidine kinase [Paenibacillus psychroresistens]|uniref:Heme sensor protein HssS n=2 Tax=Paenibacillus psychroresistens TaxID=1778678 RepID=A0A6B8RV49_9BACL|nr:sensor histidine kinase [Paenibacillus psychroresistens]